MGKIIEDYKSAAPPVYSECCHIPFNEDHFTEAQRGFLPEINITTRPGVLTIERIWPSPWGSKYTPAGDKLIVMIKDSGVSAHCRASYPTNSAARFAISERQIDSMEGVMSELESYTKDLLKDHEALMQSGYRCMAGQMKMGVLRVQRWLSDELAATPRFFQQRDIQ